MSRRYQLDRHWNGTRLSAAMISTFLDSESRTAIDIGCNEGAFSAVLAKHGLDVKGIEPNENSIRTAELLVSRMGLDVSFENRVMTTEDLEAMAPVDVSLLLSVHHQLVAMHGLEEANALLRALAAKTSRQLFFQPACVHRKYKRAVPFAENDMAAIINYFLDLLSDIFPHRAMIGYALNDVPRAEPLRPMLLFSHHPIEPSGGRDAVVNINEIRRAAWSTHPMVLRMRGILKTKR